MMLPQGYLHYTEHNEGLYCWCKPSIIWLPPTQVQRDAGFQPVKVVHGLNPYYPPILPVPVESL